MTDWINWKSDEQAKIDKDMKYFKEEIMTALYRKRLLRCYYFDKTGNKKSNISAEEFDDAVMENPRMWDEL